MARSRIYLSEEKAKELVREHSEDILRPMRSRRRSAAGITFTSQILIGNIPKSIVSCAEALDCDGIVMGTRGMSAIGNLIMGYIATKVIHLTNLPVTLVK